MSNTAWKVIVSEPFQLQHPFFGMHCQIDLETIQSFLYPLLNLKHIVTCIFSITDLIIHFS